MQAHILHLRSVTKVSPESGALMGAHVSTENVPRYRERGNSAVHPEGRAAIRATKAASSAGIR